MVRYFTHQCSWGQEQRGESEPQHLDPSGLEVEDGDNKLSSFLKGCCGAQPVWEEAGEWVLSPGQSGHVDLISG